MLFMAAFCTLAVFQLLRTGKVPIRTWSGYPEWQDRRDSPVRFWFFVVLFSLLAMGTFIQAIAYTLGYLKLEGPAG